MTLSLPADIEPFVDEFDTPAVYCLRLDRPDDLGARWDRHHDTRPAWFEALRDAVAAVYVGATGDLLARLEDHRDGAMRQASVCRVCEIDELRTVWPCESAARAFEQEATMADWLRREHPAWFVRQA